MKSRIYRLVHSGMSIADLEANYGESALIRVLDWLAPRHGGVAGAKHDAFYSRYGSAAYWRKINKTRAAFGFAPFPII